MTTGNGSLQPVIKILDNGLTVIALERRQAPIGTFWIWYRVGGRNEVAGTTGISHWVEHMLFKGTERLAKGEIFRTITANGGSLNGFTWIDYTAYFETLPVDRIDVAFQIEADRMVSSRIDPDEVASERTVIIAERQGSDNQPTTLLREEVSSAAFKAHPYGQGVIGHLSDLQAITRDDLYRHYRMFYEPGNAVAVFAGDLEAAEAIERIEEHFGGLARGPEPRQVRTAEPPQYGERRVTVHRPAPNRVVQVAYKSPQATHEDAAAMVVADAILSGGKAPGFGGGAALGRSSRLYRRLVSSGMVAATGTSYSLTIDPYLFGMSATLKPESDSEQVEAVLHEEVARLASEPVGSDELGRVIKQIRAQNAYSTESVVGAASLLGALAMTMPDILPAAWLARIEAVTPDDVMRAAGTWLTENNRTVGWLVPVDGPGRPAGASATSVALHAPAFYTPDAADLGIDETMPEVRETVLANGLRVVTLEPNPTAASRALSIRVRIPGGSAVEREAPGVAAFTASMLTRGSAGRTMDEIAEELDGIGASFGAGASREATDISGKSLIEDADTLVARLADAVLKPDFPADQIEIVRGQTLTGLRQAATDTRAEAELRLRRLLYPLGHPYRERVAGTEESVGSIIREMLVAHHRFAYGASGTIVAVAGGLSHDDAVALVSRHLGGWGGVAPRIDVPTPPAANLPSRDSAGLPGKVQSDIAAGTLGIARSDPDFHALNTANLILGRLGLMGRLGESIRERQGMAYYAFSSLETGKGVGLWSARAGVNPDNVERTIESLREELVAYLETGPNEQEFGDAIGNLIGSLPLGLETSDSVSRIAAEIVFFDLGHDYLRRYRSMILELTPEMLRAAMTRHVDPERLAIAIVGPEAESAAMA